MLHVIARGNPAPVLDLSRHPSQQELTDFFRYDADTGALLNVKGRGTARAGTEAGHIEASRCGKRYRRVCFKGKRFYAHVLIMILLGVSIPVGKEIDHRDGNGTNNRIENLRVVTHAGNMRNRNVNTNQMELQLLAA